MSTPVAVGAGLRRGRTPSYCGWMSALESGRACSSASFASSPRLLPLVAIHDRKAWRKFGGGSVRSGRTGILLARELLGHLDGVHRELARADVTASARGPRCPRLVLGGGGDRRVGRQVPRQRVEHRVQPGIRRPPKPGKRDRPRDADARGARRAPPPARRRRGRYRVEPGSRGWARKSSMIGGSRSSGRPRGWAARSRRARALPGSPRPRAGRACRPPRWYALLGPAGPEKVCCATLTRVPPWLSRMSTDSTPVRLARRTT